MSYQYGPPGTGVPERPRCWGQEQFHDPNDRGCRVCPSRQSCADQIVRIKNTQAQQQVQQFGFMAQQQINPQQMQQQQFVPFIPAPAVQQPVQQVQPIFGGAAAIPQVVRAFAPVQQQQMAPVYPQQMAQRPMSPHPAPTGYGFGWMQDPLYYQMAANPPPVRPQFEGEQFMERLGKNVGLAMAEALLMQLFLGIRQVVLTPKTPPAKDVGQV